VSQQTTFRRIALDRLSSPDELDRVLSVTGLRSWILLAALCTVFGTAVIWSGVAVVPLKVAGPGILLKSGGVFSIVSTLTGRVADVSANVGESVKEGQVVARIAQFELVERLQEAQVRLSNLKQEHAFLLASGNRELQVQIEGLDQQARNLKQAIADDEKRAKYFEEKVVSQQQLVNEGRLVRQTLINTVQELDASNQQIRSRRADLTELELRALQARSQRDGAEQKSSFAIKEAEVQVAQLERGLTSGSEVRSPYTGRIIEIAAERGGIVNRGETLFTLDLTGRTVAGLEAMVYVPATDGKRIVPGMSVQIAPATVRPEEYGYLLGKVTYVSDLPATARGMLRALKSEELVKTMMGATPPHDVRVDLVPDMTFSGYRWSSRDGPPSRIQSGTLCGATVIVEQRRPIEMVVPFFRKAGGV
jgi:HlyD family secretion protein